MQRNISVKVDVDQDEIIVEDDKLDSLTFPKIVILLVNSWWHNSRLQTFSG